MLCFFLLLRLKENPIPRLTARLKSLSVKPELLENCVLLRDIEASMPTTGVSILTGTGPCVPMSVINAYLPEPGEYALEVYAAPPGSDETTEQTAYHLVRPHSFLFRTLMTGNF